VFKGGIKIDCCWDNKCGVNGGGELEWYSLVDFALLTKLLDWWTCFVKLLYSLKQFVFGLWPIEDGVQYIWSLFLSEGKKWLSSWFESFTFEFDDEDCCKGLGNVPKSFMFDKDVVVFNISWCLWMLLLIFDIEVGKELLWDDDVFANFSSAEVFVIPGEAGLLFVVFFLDVLSTFCCTWKISLNKE